ncbi:tyrosine-protein kinase family protein [Colwellia piezophila]|uniref:tyrosine-protein kinase family protein n=1 Tax=Colwellia piezophila TaxID=211668 RepID=UPI0003741A30|nr:tyrosine-protein kinase family protein [Colwellia piezophila]
MQELPIHYAEVEAIYNQTIGSGYKTLAITSAKAGEGKTTLAQAIVKRAQVVGKNVLLVETNTFNPVLSEELRSSMGDIVTENTIITVESKGYSLLPAPKSIRDLLQYRESHLLLAAIKQWLVDFDCIIFDTSALTSLNQSNIPAEIVCEVCEGALLVIEAGITPANLIQESIEKLKLKKVNLIGSILNDKNNPSLLTELQRETYRLNHLFPNVMVSLRKKLAGLVLLNISV